MKSAVAPKRRVFWFFNRRLMPAASFSLCAVLLACDIEFPLAPVPTPRAGISIDVSDGDSLRVRILAGVETGRDLSDSGHVLNEALEIGSLILLPERRDGTSLSFEVEGAGPEAVQLLEAMGLGPVSFPELAGLGRPVIPELYRALRDGPREITWPPDQDLRLPLLVAGELPDLEWSLEVTRTQQVAHSRLENEIIPDTLVVPALALGPCVVEPLLVRARTVGILSEGSRLPESGAYVAEMRMASDIDWLVTRAC